MSNNVTDTNPTGRATALLPEGLSYLLRDKPLLWCESEAEYDELLGGIFAEFDPKGLIETMLVKDIVDYVWEIRRLRAMKIAALHAELPTAAGVLLERGHHEALRAMHAEQVKPIVFAAVSGLPTQAQSLQSQMLNAHVTPQMMQYEALKSGLTAMSAIEALIARAERRRDQLMKQVSERRQAFKAMARTLLERDGADLPAAGGGSHN
jgi:hypothetical protein